MDEYNVAVINGQNEFDENSLEGKIDRFGNKIKKELHVSCLLKYAKEKYPNIDIFKRLNRKHPAQVIAYFLVQLNHIVFLNITSEPKSNQLQKREKRGIFLLPPSISDEQRESLNLFCKEIEDFNVGLYCDMSIDQGHLEGNEIYPLHNESPKQILDLYYNKGKDLEIKSNKVK